MSSARWGTRSNENSQIQNPIKIRPRYSHVYGWGASTQLDFCGNVISIVALASFQKVPRLVKEFRWHVTVIAYFLLDGDTRITDHVTYISPIKATLSLFSLNCTDEIQILSYVQQDMLFNRSAASPASFRVVCVAHFVGRQSTYLERDTTF